MDVCDGCKWNTPIGLLPLDFLQSYNNKQQTTNNNKIDVIMTGYNHDTNDT